MLGRQLLSSNIMGNTNTKPLGGRSSSTAVALPLNKKSVAIMAGALTILVMSTMTVTMSSQTFLGSSPNTVSAKTGSQTITSAAKLGGQEQKQNVLKTGKRWAVLMIGAVRSYTFARSSLMQNVIYQTDPPMDIFSSTEMVSNSSCHIEGLSLEHLEKDSSFLRFHSSWSNKPMSYKEKLVDRFVTEQTALWQLMEDYSKANNITYDYILYARPDLYYTMPLNVKEVERRLDSGLVTFFSPKCCSYGGWCDRIGAASYQDFSRMILSSEDWVNSGGDKYLAERAFQDRGEYANLTRFDLITKEDYGFLTLRLGNVAQLCNGEKVTRTFWCDLQCNNFSFPYDLEPTPASCRLLNVSNPASCDVYLKGPKPKK